MKPHCLDHRHELSRFVIDTPLSDLAQTPPTTMTLRRRIRTTNTQLMHFQNTAARTGLRPQNSCSALPSNWRSPIPTPEKPREMEQTPPLQFAHVPIR